MAAVAGAIETIAARAAIAVVRRDHQADKDKSRGMRAAAPAERRPRKALIAI